MFLPNDLVLRILEFSDEIETRIHFKIPPKKLKVHARKFEPRPEIIYDHMSRTMWDFTGLTDDQDHPYWILRKGVKFSQYRSPGLHVFNMGWEDYQMTMFSGTQQVGPTTCSNHLVVSNKRVKFK
jgi:hypothetical protein